MLIDRIFFLLNLFITILYIHNIDFN